MHTIVYLINTNHKQAKTFPIDTLTSTRYLLVLATYRNPKEFVIVFTGILPQEISSFLFQDARHTSLFTEINYTTTNTLYPILLTL